MQWEYLVVPFYSDPGAREMVELNQLGAEGWELIGFTLANGNTRGAVLKRPSSEVAPNRGISPSGV